MSDAVPSSSGSPGQSPGDLPADLVEPAFVTEVAERALRAVPAGAEAQVHARASRHALTRFANSAVHQNLAVDGLTVTLKLAIGGRVAVATTSRVDPEGLADLAARAAEAASVRPVDPHWPGVAGPLERSAPATGSPGHWSEATAAASAEERARAVADFLAEGGAGHDGAGFCDTLAVASAVATTGGRRIAGRSTRATIDGMFMAAPEGGHTPAGHGHHTSVDLADVLAGAPAAGATAARLCSSSQGAGDLPPGEYAVVLMPECMADVLSYLGDGFSAKAVQEGQSFAELGRALFDPALTFLDDVRPSGTVGLDFDVDGTERRPVTLIDAGRCAGLLHDRRSAARQRALSASTAASSNAGSGVRSTAEVHSTGHAHPGSDSWGPGPAALHLLGGTASEAELLAGLERGLLVTCLNYSRVLDPKTMEVTGLTRNGTFWVEDGRIVRPLTNLRYTQSFVDALGPGRVEAIGSAARYADCEWGPGLVRTPAVRLSSWRFTGGAAG